MLYFVENYFMPESPLPLNAAENSVENSVLGANEALNRLVSKTQHVQDLLEADMQGLGALEAKVLRSVKRKELLAHNVNLEMDANLTWSQRMADWFTNGIGTMTFVYWNAALFALWIAINLGWIPAIPVFDAFPFGLLTMIVSLEAIFLSLFVLISQNRTAEKDRIRGEYDYKTDLKAEIEIRHLSQKMDLFVEKMWQRHLEVQSAQVELLREISERVKGE